MRRNERREAMRGALELRTKKMAQRPDAQLAAWVASSQRLMAILVRTVNADIVAAMVSYAKKTATQTIISEETL